MSGWEPAPLSAADRLYDVAHARAGDKGDTLNVVVIPFDAAIYGDLLSLLTEERVATHFDHLITGGVRRYPVPGLSAINFVLEGALDGGVTRSLRVDRHGKTLSRHMLALPIDGA